MYGKILFQNRNSRFQRINALYSMLQKLSITLDLKISALDQRSAMSSVLFFFTCSRVFHLLAGFLLGKGFDDNFDV